MEAALQALLIFLVQAGTSYGVPAFGAAYRLLGAPQVFRANA
ncbi:hypothetical protein [Kribbella endophytica]